MSYKKWDEIDQFLYYDFWHRNGHEQSLEIRKNNIIDLFEIAKNNKLKLFLGDLTIFNILKSKQGKYDLSIKAEYLVAFSKDKKKWIDEFNNNNFDLVSNRKNNYFILRDNRLLIISFIKDKKIFKKIANINLFQNIYPYFVTTKLKIYLYHKPFSFFKILKSKVFSLKVNYQNRISQKKLIRNLGIEQLEKNKIYKIDLNTFLNLNIENKHSPSWLVRKNHLNLVTNNKKNLKIAEIIDFFKKGNNYKKTFENIEESIIDTPVLGSISHSKKFWHSGNNYFFYSMHFKFKKNVLAYKSVNDYIFNKNKPLIYTKKYFESLQSMDTHEIVVFLKNNPIEITHNSISSGKHRVFAMIGRLINDEEYIPFYSKIV